MQNIGSGRSLLKASLCKNLIRAGVALLVLGVLVFLGSGAYAHKRAERRRLNTAAARFVIIDVDDASVDTYGVWPWNHDVFRVAAERMRKAGPAVVFFDIEFVEGDSAQLTDYLTSLGNVFTAGPEPPRSPYPPARQVGGFASPQLTPDRDGVVREIRSFDPARGLPTGPAVLSAVIDNTPLPGPRSNAAQIEWPDSTFQHISFAKMMKMSPADLRRELSGRAVIVGATGKWSGTVQTGRGGLPHVEVEAAAAATLLAGARPKQKE